MHGTIPKKIGRVIANLITHPQYIPRCIVHNIVNGHTPLDLQTPWFSYAAIDFLDKFIQPDMTVFEYGSGGSTLFSASRAKSVLAVENDSRWYGLVTQRLQEKGVANVTLKLCPFDFRKASGFENSEYFLALPDRPFDIIVIDGSEEWIQARPVCFK